MLKSRFHWSQTGAVLVQTMYDRMLPRFIGTNCFSPRRPRTQVGLYCGITQGLFYDRCGVRRAALLASLLICAGFLVAFGLAHQTSMSPVAFGACFFLVGQGSHGLYTSR